MKGLHPKLFWLTILLLPTQIGRHFWPQESYLLGLKIDYLSPTIYLTDILILGTVFFWLVSLSWLKVRNMINKRLFLLIIFLLLVNVLIAVNPLVASYKVLKLAEFLLFGLYIVKNKITPKQIFLPLSLSLVATLIVALLQFWKQGSLNGIWWFLGERTFNSSTPGIATAIFNHQLVMRPYATFPHPNALAGFSLIVSILLLGNVSKKRKIVWIQATLFICGMVVVAISFSRTAWFATLAGLTVYLMRKVNHVNGKIFLTVCLILITLLLVDISLPLSGHQAFDQRKDLLVAAWQMVKESPLLGIGLNNFLPVYAANWLNNAQTFWLQPVHNIFVLTAAEAGLVGIAGLTFFLTKSFLKVKKDNKSALMIALFLIMITGLTDHYWLTLQQNQLLLTLVLALCWC